MYPVIKRLTDIVVSGAILVLLAPLALLLIPLLRLTGEGEVWYWQKRIGRHNRYFPMLKFATMLRDSPNLGTGAITVRNDPRVTPVGRYLRLTKLNELPQFFNVLRGDMSLVGPRPLVDSTFQAYPPSVQERIYSVMPGITGIGSIVFRDEEAILAEADDDPKAFYRDVVAPYKGELEMWYLDNASLGTDLKLLFLTAWVTFSFDKALPYRIFPTLPEPPAALAFQFPFAHATTPLS